MIVVKLISGLGNQLFQYALGRQLSILRNVSLKLDTSFFKDQQFRSFKLSHYNISASVASETEVSNFLALYTGNSLYDKICRKIEARLPKNKKRYYKEDQWWTYEAEVFNVSSNVYLDGYWQHYKYFQNIHPLIIKELTVKESYTPAVNKLIGETKQNAASVSIHIRRGDYITDRKAYELMGLLPPEYYYKAIEYINSKLRDPAFYVFSDDLDWVKDNLKLHGSINYVDMEEGGTDYIELDVMSKCNHNIIANSSFSWWAAFLNQNPDKIVIAPDKWVLPKEINKRVELQFPTWIKI